MTGIVILILLITLLYLYAKSQDETRRAETFISLSDNYGDMTTSDRNEDYLDYTHKIRCAGDNIFGNQLRLVNPMDVYGPQQDNERYGYEFRFKNDQITKAVYQDPREAMRAYCSNPSRVLDPRV